MYNPEYFAAAERIAKRRTAVLAIVLALALAGYVAAILAGFRWLMLAILLAGFLFAVFYGDLKLLPALRCRKFLGEMRVGLRRNLLCRVDARDQNPQLQDGLRVYAQQVRLPDGDTRIFYLNADHAPHFPEQGTCIRLESYGRHITGFELFPKEAETC